MDRSAETVVTGIESALNGIVFAGIASMAASRARRADRLAYLARCEVAAHAAASSVRVTTEAALRSRLADCEEDVAALTAQREELQDRLDVLCAYLVDLERIRPKPRLVAQR